MRRLSPPPGNIEFVTALVTAFVAALATERVRVLLSPPPGNIEFVAALVAAFVTERVRVLLVCWPRTPPVQHTWVNDESSPVQPFSLSPLQEI